MPPPPPPVRRPPAAAPAPPVVDPVWLLKALGVSLLAAVLLGYLALCLLFYQGQWQLVLHPARTAAPLPSPPCTPVRFDIDSSATPQLTACMLPADPGARYAAFTLLYLRGGDGSLADSLPALASLHALGLNVFAIDYRGYGQSAGLRPSQQSMSQDASQAWSYLTGPRAIPASHLILYGAGVGASIATTLAASHWDPRPGSAQGVAALILEAPKADLLDEVRADPRARLLPVRRLFHDRFPLAAPLSTLTTPKLLISFQPHGTLPPAFVTAALPRLTVELNTPDPAALAPSLTRFLDQYLPPSPIEQIAPAAAPPSR